MCTAVGTAAWLFVWLRCYLRRLRARIQRGNPERIRLTCDDWCLFSFSPCRPSAGRILFLFKGFLPTGHCKRHQTSFKCCSFCLTWPWTELFEMWPFWICCTKDLDLKNYCGKISGFELDVKTATRTPLQLVLLWFLSTWQDSSGMFYVTKYLVTCLRHEFEEDTSLYDHTGNWWQTFNLAHL